jgi:hypothetical protein
VQDTVLELLLWANQPLALLLLAWLLLAVLAMLTIAACWYTACSVTGHVAIQRLLDQEMCSTCVAKQRLFRRALQAAAEGHHVRDYLSTSECICYPKLLRSSTA